MHADVTSKHLRGTAELMLIVPIKPGFVQSRELVTYATRLRRLLNALFEANRWVAEYDLEEGDGPIQRLRSIFTTQWAVVDDLVAPRLFVSACFDRPWEDYVELLVEKTGALLDAIFCHCEGYENSTCLDGYEAFSGWLRRHQISCDFFYAATPDMTVDDLRYQRKLAEFAAANKPASDVFVRSPELEAKPQDPSLSIATKLYGFIGELFPDVREFPDRNERTALDILRSAAASFVASEAPSSITKAVKLAPRDLASIQGNVLRGYDGMTHGVALLVQCETPSALIALLRRLCDRITTEVDTAKAVRLNLALTYAALRRLELGEDTLKRFPKEFREGMEARAGLLGDVGVPQHPDFWQEPRSNWPTFSGRLDQKIQISSIDLVVTMQGPFDRAPTEDYAFGDEHPLVPFVKELALEAVAGVQVVHVQTLRRIYEGKDYREHFGFLDSASGRSGSQPIPNVELAGESLVTGAAERDKLPLGELLLGYEDRRGASQPCASYELNAGSAALFRNGTFMVLRKLRQHTDRFDEFAERAAERLRHDGASASAEQVKSWVVGRQLNGEPLFRSKAPEGKELPANEFTFDGDEGGKHCPLHAHIRRANPRDGSNVPRIVRRGFSYGPPPRYGKSDDDRGLFFIALGSSIAEQFEVVQRWLNGGNSTGLSSAQNDVFTGMQPRGAPRWVHTKAGPKALAEPKAPLVTLSWGAYLFVPSKEAVKWLIERAEARDTGPSAELLNFGAELLSRLDQLAQSDAEQAKQAWKRVLEQPESQVEAAAVWAALAAGGHPVKRTPYGLLVASITSAETVLADGGERFSVREYWPRLKETMGEHYLSFDRSPAALRCPHSAARDEAYERRLRELSYHSLSNEPNDFIETLGQDAYQHALAYTRAYIAAVAAARVDAAEPAILDVKQLAMFVIGRLAQKWLGMPLPEDCDPRVLAAFVEHFVAISQYAFQPYPERWLAEDARARGKILREAYESGALTGMMVDALRRGGHPEPAVRQAVIGAIVGFAAPALASATTILVSFIRSQELWRFAQALGQKSDEERRDALRTPVIGALLRAPVPPILYRTAIERTVLDGVATEPGELVVVGLAAAAAGAAAHKRAEPWQWLFGGAHGESAGDGKPPHGCPARYAVRDALVGIVSAVVEQHDLASAGPTVLRFRPKDTSSA